MADDAPVEIQLADDIIVPEYQDDAAADAAAEGEADRVDDDRDDDGERMRDPFDRDSLYSDPPFRFEWLTFTNRALLALGSWCVAAAMLTFAFWPRAPWIPPVPPPPPAAASAVSAAECGIVTTGGTAAEQSACLLPFVQSGVSYNACTTAKLDALSCESPSLASHLDACKPVSTAWCTTARNETPGGGGGGRFGQCVDTCVQQPLRRQRFSELGSPSAVCMDGTSSGYYWSEATTQPTIYVLYLQGGNWCYDEDSCSQRCGPRSGSNCSNPLAGSNSWPEWRYAGGLLSSSPSVSPVSGAHKAFLGYCTSDGHMGDADA